MPIVTIAIVHFCVILIIGILVGVAFNRAGRTILTRAASSVTGVGIGTYALVGIAGSFIGFHVAVILGLLPSPLMLYVSAAIGAAVTVWLWRR
jgi:uncharacterized membrane protein